MANGRGRTACRVVLVALATAVAAAAQTSSPTPSPGPTPRPKASPSAKPLKLDVEEHVEKVMEEHEGDLRFQEEIDVTGRTPEAALLQHFRDFDLECGPAGGPPTAVESREARPHPAPYVDMTALAGLLAGLGSKGKGPERYFLYRVNRGDNVVFTVREDRLATADGAAPGGTFELVETFPDLSSAVRAWQRMERGFATPVGPDAPKTPLWATTTCRPRKR